MNKPLQLAIAKTLGTNVREQAAAAPAAPVLSDPIAILKFVEMDVGADAFAFKGRKLLALRDRGDGTWGLLKEYEVEEFGGRA
jgi:hypothetical protein